jgi:hypothetical protein
MTGLPSTFLIRNKGVLLRFEKCNFDQCLQGLWHMLRIFEGGREGGQNQHGTT